MVYFECSKCNESLKKPKVAKHLQSCRSNSVICIDCGKTFGWDEYETHTQCVSEAQKYQGSLYSAKESENKGAKKQNSWLEIVQQTIADPGSNIPAPVKANLEKLLGFDNIPRKQKPFGNFVKNSLKLWDERAITAIWDVIHAANEAAKKQAPPKWAGFKRALDDTLSSADGKTLPWKRLRDAVAELAKAGGASEAKGVSDDDLQRKVLVTIPENYLSKEDNMVRLP